MVRSFILSDYLSLLGVPHTEEYTDRRFDSMPFRSLFGLSKLLQEYKIPSEAYRLQTKDEVMRLPTPFLAHTPKGFVIVTGICGGSVSYLTEGVSESIPYADFLKAWDGVVFLAYPQKDSREPCYCDHARKIFFDKAKSVTLIVLALLMFAYLFITNGIWRHPTTILLTVIDLIGVYMSFLLVQKSMKIKNPAADRVCGVLQAGGCDHVLEDKASSFYGIFSWSEVGLSYFSVSLMALLVFPQWICYLAACNVCCLPFTFWSVWYQKFRAKAWCTLCLSVQCSLWLLFVCYLTGGWLKGIFPLRIEFFVLVAAYGITLLGLNKILPKFDKTPVDNESTETADAS